MTKLISITALFVLIVSSVQARTVRAIFLKPPAGAPQSAYLFNGVESIEVKLPSRNLSPVEKLPKGHLELQVLQNPLVEGDPVPAGAQKIIIPETWKETILLFIPSAKKKRGFPAKVLVMNASKENFGMGETMVYNLSKTVFIGKLGESEARVKANRSGIVKAPLKVPGTYPVAIDCLLPNKERRAVIRSTWIHNVKARRILFVIPEEGKELPKVWGVLDRTKAVVEKPVP